MGNSDRKTAAIRKLLDKADCPSAKERRTDAKSGWKIRIAYDDGHRVRTVHRLETFSQAYRVALPNTADEQRRGKDSNHE